MLTIENDDDYSFPRQPGQLVRQEIVLANGKWTLTANSDGPMFISPIASNNDPTGDWTSFDGEFEITVEYDENKRRVLVGYGVNTGADEFSFSAEREEEEVEEGAEEDCPLECTDIPETRDICLVGVWENLNMPTHVTPSWASISYRPSPPVDTYFPDGTYTHDVPILITADRSGVRSITKLDVNRKTGRWGTDGNRLVTYENAETVVGGSEITVPGAPTVYVNMDKDRNIDPVRESSYRYTCDETGLQLKAGLFLRPQSYLRQ